jgi:adenosine/AMP kinase
MTDQTRWGIPEVQLRNKLRKKRGIIMQSERGPNDLEEIISTLRQRVKELMAINESHQQLMGRMTQENEELKKDNKRLAKQVSDYFNAR